MIGSKIKTELNNCNDVSQMFNVLNNHYDTNSCYIGIITKTVIVSGINNALKENKLSAKGLDNLNTLGDMINILSKHYSATKLEPINKSRIIEGFSTIIKMTNCKLK